jgi:hypothetical protein
MSIQYPPRHARAGTATRAATRAARWSEDRATSLLYALLAALTLANAGDLALTAAGVRALGLAAEINPLLHLVMAWGGIPAFVGAKFVCSVAEVLLALLIWSAVRRSTAGDRRGPGSGPPGHRRPGHRRPGHRGKRYRGL